MELSKTTNNETARVPHWKVAVQKLLADGITYGAIIKTETLEELLQCNRNSMDFGFAVSDIRRELEGHGLYLSGRGEKNERFIVLHPEKNAHIMSAYAIAARDNLKRAVMLGSTTDISLLDVEKRAHHERVLERMQNKLALMSRRGVK